MSLNPPFDINGSPLRVQNEFFIMQRSDLTYNLSFDNSSTKYQGKGRIILTTCRLIIVNSNRIDQFKGYELPLTMIHNEKYSTPLIGTNFLSGDCVPMFGNSLGKVHFTLTFIKTCGTFVTGFFILLDSLRVNSNKGHDLTIINAIKDNNYNKVFPVDKSDPSEYIYDQPDEIEPLKPMSQSVIANNNNQNNMLMMNKNLNESGIRNVHEGFKYQHPDNFQYKSVQYANPQPMIVYNYNNQPQQIWKNPYPPQNNIIQEENNYSQNDNSKDKVFPLFPENYNEKKKEQNQQIIMPYPSFDSNQNQNQPYYNPSNVSYYPNPQVSQQNSNQNYYQINNNQNMKDPLLENNFLDNYDYNHK